MPLMRIYRAGLIALATLFFALQSAAISHAAQYGDDIHEHNGIVCTVDAIASEQNVIVPTPEIIQTPVPEFIFAFYPGLIDAPAVTPPGRAPPPRSPPSLSQ